LLERAGRVVSTEEIIEHVWGYESSPAGAATLVTHIRRLRSHIERDPHHPVLIRNLRGLGYIVDVVPVPEGGTTTS
jgi:two-component system alkaline phosphatase synthesis response regulator PhoP